MFDGTVMFSALSPVNSALFAKYRTDTCLTCRYLLEQYGQIKRTKTLKFTECHEWSKLRKYESFCISLCRRLIRKCNYINDLKSRLTSVFMYVYWLDTSQLQPFAACVGLSKEPKSNWFCFRSADSWQENRHMTLCLFRNSINLVTV